MARSLVVKNPWEKLKTVTDARIALGRAGTSLPTDEWLKFQLEHAQARDAVHTPLDVAACIQQFRPQALDLLPNGQPFSPRVLASQAIDRGTYLQRPDLGRRLNIDSAQAIDEMAAQYPNGCDLVIVCVDGLSSTAIEKNAVPFIQCLLPAIDDRVSSDMTLAPILFCTQGRVAIGDDIAQRLKAKVVMVLIGERPGLSSPDSMGLYLTYAPKVGTTDAQRNCISNIRDGGLSYAGATRKAVYLLMESIRLKLSGVGLKERTEGTQDVLKNTRNFLTEECG